MNLSTRFLSRVLILLIWMLLTACNSSSKKNTTNPVFTSSSIASVYEYKSEAITLEATNTTAYSINGGDSDSFVVNTSTGVVTFKTAPKYDVKNLYTFTAKASNGSNQVTQNVTINISKITISFNEQNNRINPLGSYEFDSDPYDVTLSSDGSKAFVASASGLHIIDINNQSTPTLLGTYPNTDGVFFRLAISSDNTKAYIASEKMGLLIIDISNPSSPTLLGTYDISSSSVALTSDNAKAIITSKELGLHIIDVSDPTSPTFLGSYGTHESQLSAFLDIAISDDNTKAFVVDSNIGGWALVEGQAVTRLLIIDIKNPSSPALLGSHSFPVRSRTYDRASYPGITLTKDGTKALLITDEFESHDLNIVDVSNPSSPIKLGVYYAGFRYSFFSNISLFGDDTKLFLNVGSLGDSGAPQLIDISTPESPTRLRSYNYLMNSINIVTSEDGKRTVVLNNKQLHTLRLNDSSSSLLNTHTIMDNSNATTKLLSRNATKAFVTKGAALNILDISNPDSPLFLGSFNISAGQSIEKISLSADEKMLSLLAETSAVVFIDVSDPTSPKFIADYYDGGDYVDITFSSDAKKLIMTGETSFLLLDVSKLSITDDPQSPDYPVLGFFNLEVSDPLNTLFSSKIRDIAFSKDGTKAFVIVSSSSELTLRIVDLSNLTLLGTYLFTNNGQYSIRNASVAVSKDGTKAFLSNGRSELQIIDVSNPSSPTLLSSYVHKGFKSFDYLNNVVHSDNYAKVFLTNSTAGILIIDVSNSSSPTLISTYYVNNDNVPYAAYNDLPISSDTTKAFFSYRDDTDVKLGIIDLTVDTLNKPQDFGDSNLELRIFSNTNIPLTMTVEVDRSDIVSIGTYDSELSFNEYDRQVVTIPISSITKATGQTIFTISLSYEDYTITRNVHLNTYPKISL